MANRISQVAVEVAIRTNPNARVSQVAVEVAIAPATSSGARAWGYIIGAVRQVLRGAWPRWRAMGRRWPVVGRDEHVQPGARPRSPSDGSGADRYYGSGGTWFADWGFYTPTTTANRYSIRANTIR